ncbi:MAG: hypothetical protein GC136_02415 [Alphaproteobacteria bacterium]|nr:hypothetical protein [Alphaproteobacteria bacterium]
MSDLSAAVRALQHDYEIQCKQEPLGAVSKLINAAGADDRLLADLLVEHHMAVGYGPLTYCLKGDALARQEANSIRDRMSALNADVSATTPYGITGLIASYANIIRGIEEGPNLPKP